jgi:hypothetical protein
MAFDFSQINPMIAALSARFPELMDLRIQEARKAPSRTDEAFREYIENQRSSRDLAQQRLLSDRSAQDASAALAKSQHFADLGQINTANAARDAATPAVSEPVNYGTMVGGPQASAYQRMTGQMTRMAGAGRPIANYTGLTDLANAGAGSSAQATAAAGRNAAGGGCPAGMKPSPSGGCQPAGTGY